MVDAIAGVAVFSAVVSVLALAATAWSANAADRSAKAAEQSASIQQDQWNESKEARLYVQYGGDHKSIRDRSQEGVQIRFTLKVRNEGRSPAFDLGASSNTPVPNTPVSPVVPSAINPQDQKDLVFEFSDPFAVAPVFFWKVTMFYRDGFGKHRFETVFRLERETRVSSTMTNIVLASAILDGEPHFLHPDDAGRGRLELPDKL